MKKVAVALHAVENFDVAIIKGLNYIDFIHVDVMDGKFVNNTNLNLETFRILKENTSVPLVAHLMVNNPHDYIDKIINFADIILFHFEAENDIKNTIDKVKIFNKKVGLVINPETEISEITPFLKDIDQILVMSVHPGWSGQKFIPDVIKKINLLARYKKEYQFEISVDGGINLNNAKTLKNVDILCSSSTILKAKDPNLIIKKLKNID